MTTKTQPKPQYIGVRELAEELGVDQPKVLRWIASGDLRAFDLSQSSNERPRWKISRADLESFLRSRAARPEEPRPPRKRKEESDNWF